jgi:hypothetical protein
MNKIAALQQKLALKTDMFVRQEDNFYSKQNQKNQFEEKGVSDSIE